MKISPVLYRVVEVLIVIAVGVLLFITTYPQYKDIKEKNLMADVKTNMYFLQAAVEHYIADNFGKLPKSVDDIVSYIEQEGGFPVNPCTKRPLTRVDIREGKYEYPWMVRDEDPNGPNGKWEGAPGTMMYITFTPENAEEPFDYAIIGFGADGKPLFYLDSAKKKKIFVLHKE